MVVRFGIISSKKSEESERKLTGWLHECILELAVNSPQCPAMRARCMRMHSVGSRLGMGSGNFGFGRLCAFLSPENSRSRV